MSAGEAMVAAIEQAGEDYARLVEGLSDEQFKRRPAVEEWTTEELTGHVAEFPTTFADQARRLAASPGLRVGRTLDDPGRLAAVGRLEGAGPAEAAGKVRGAVHRAISELRQIPAEGWRVKGQHVRLGEMAVAELVEHLILDHLRDHLDQAKVAAGTAS